MKIPVTQRIEQLLLDAPNSTPYAEPGSFTHRELAIEVYFDGYPNADPTDAQLAHVRRAVRALVSAGKAESYRPDDLERTRWDPMRKGTPPVVVRRTPTAEDQATLDRRLALAHKAMREDPQVQMWMDIIRETRASALRAGRNVGTAVRERSDAITERLNPRLREANNWAKESAELLLVHEARGGADRRSDEGR